MRDSPRILVIRLQAIGDCIVVLPYLRALRAAYPSYQIEFMTQPVVAEALHMMNFLDGVHAVRPAHNNVRRLLHAVPAATRALSKRYDCVLDLQDNVVSRFVRRFHWSSSKIAMQKLERKHHVERFLDAIQIAGLDPDAKLYAALPQDAPLVLDDYVDREIGVRALRRMGVAPEHELVILNPAGAFLSRNWPLGNYVEFAERFRKAGHADARFLVCGLEDKVGEKARWLGRAIGEGFHDLVGRTTLVEVMAILQHATLVVSEDSALMHMAWTAGRPTVAIMGASTTYWGRPLGRHTANLDSANLPCAWCLQAECPLGHYQCLTQYTPARVLAEAIGVLARQTRTRERDPAAQ